MLKEREIRQWPQYTDNSHHAQCKRYVSSQKITEIKWIESPFKNPRRWSTSYGRLLSLILHFNRTVSKTESTTIHDYTFDPLNYEVLRYGSQGISQFYLHTPRSFANRMNHTCLCLPSRNWCSFTDPRGMEGWVDLCPCVCWPWWLKSHLLHTGLRTSNPHWDLDTHNRQ